MHAARLVGIVGRDDVGMLEPGGRAHLALEPGHGRASLVSAAGSILMATMRSMRRCWALNTWPMPPAPILSSIV